MLLEQEELDLLLHTVERWFATNDSTENRNENSENSYRSELDSWLSFAEMGWLGLTLPEESGGFNADFDTALKVAKLCGSQLRAEPLGMHFMISSDIALAMPEAAESLVNGTMRVGIAEMKDATFISNHEREDNIVSGVTGCVLGIENATHYLLLVNEVNSSQTIPILIENDSNFVEIIPARLLDQRHSAQLSVTNSKATILASYPLSDNWCFIKDKLAMGMIADAAGVFEKGFDITLDYLKQREQFGWPLSSLQAVQHQMASVFCDVQQMNALLERLGQEHKANPSGPWKSLSSAKAFVGRRVLRGLGQLIQLSGGIGVTEEYMISHLYRRAHVAAVLFGNAEEQLKRISAKNVLGS